MTDGEEAAPHECEASHPPHRLLSDGELCWSLWQVLDSVLPTGGFAHSLGLEVTLQLGYVSSSASLLHFGISTLESAGALLLPFVFAAATQPTLMHWKALDTVLHAMLANQVTRRASVAQGTSLLRVAASVFSEVAELEEMRACVRREAGVVNVHHAPVFGVLCGLLGVDAMTAQRAFLFLTLRDLLSAAVRLNVVGPLEAASLQHRLMTSGEKILSKYANRSVQDVHQTAPLLDTIQGCHDQLLSRLFRS